MDNIPSLIFVKDEGSRIVYANKAFLDVYPPERRDHIIGFTTVENFSEEEAAVFLAEDRRAFILGYTELVEEIRSWTGQRRVFKTRKIAFSTPTGERRLLAVSDDITELAERERALAEANRHLESFAALAAHDLRSPLGSVVGALELVKRDRDTVLGVKAGRFVDLAITTARSLADTVRSLLIAAKFSFQSEAMDVQACDLNLALEDVRSALSALIQHTGALIYSNRLPTIAVEATLFRQLLQNLIENSIKYKSHETPLIMLRYEGCADGHRFAIEDNGKGMSAATATKAFDQYEQGDGASAHGVGLGLNLCKRIVELHGGRIWVEAHSGKGCKISWTVRETHSSNGDPALKAAS